MGRDMQKEEGWETTRLCFALVREKLNARFEEYCGAWERILSHDKVAAWKAEDYFSEYAGSDILKEGIRVSVENALGAVTNINEWSKEEKRTRYVATAGHNVITVREKRMAHHKEYDKGKAVADWLQASKEYLTEIKKSDADVEAAKWQTLYYLKILKEKGIVRKGKIEFLEKNKTAKKTIIVELGEKEETELNRYMGESQKLIEGDEIPSRLDKAQCKKCAYYEYCYIS